MQYLITLRNNSSLDGIYIEVRIGLNANCDTNLLLFTNRLIPYGQSCTFGPPEGGIGCWKKLPNPVTGEVPPADWISSTPIQNEEFNL
jgi:hypothetical protein